MKNPVRAPVPAVIFSAVLIAGLLIWWRFDQDLKLANARAAQGSVLATTRCGPIEYQERGTDVPLLMVHGSGGGHDQGMAFAGSLTQRGIRVIAMSRFGYLRTPMPPDASPAAQADAHVCLLDALGIRAAAVLGGSAGGPSAMQMAIRHPDWVSALVLLVPLAWKPADLADSAPSLAPWAESLMMRLIGSDFLFWAGLHLARDGVIKSVLATLPEQVAAASPQERARVHAMLANILPVSARVAGPAQRLFARKRHSTLRAGSDPRADTHHQHARRWLRHFRQRTVHRQPDRGCKICRLRYRRPCLGRT